MTRTATTVWQARGREASTAAGRRAAVNPGRRVARAIVIISIFAFGPRAALAAQEQPPIGREAAESLRFPPLAFTPPTPSEHEVEGAQVLFLADRSLPLVNVLARFEGGFGLFDRDMHAAVTALPSLLRSGGTRSIAPDSVDGLIDFHALQLGFGSSGGSTSATLNTLVSNLDDGLELWKDMLLHPRFDSVQVEVWRRQELESVLRRKDDPTRLAYSEFNRLMFADHPIGWEMEAADLEPEDLSETRLLAGHAAVMCRDNLSLGVTGDVAWADVEPRLRALLSDWPRCEMSLPDPKTPDILGEPGVYLIPKPLAQTTVVMAHPSAVRQEDSEDYYSSRIANSILGASGFSSRILSRVRTELGLAYSAGSLWTAPAENDGIVGALTSTKSETTVAAVRAILEVMEEMRESPPTEEEVSTAVDAAANGFGFNFQSATQIVSRLMLFRARELPDDWLERYVERIQSVSPGDVREVLRRHLHPERMTILLLGDPSAFDEPADVLGDVTIWQVDGLTDPPPAQDRVPPR